MIVRKSNPAGAEGTEDMEKINPFSVISAVSAVKSYCASWYFLGKEAR